MGVGDFSVSSGRTQARIDARGKTRAITRTMAEQMRPMSEGGFRTGGTANKTNSGINKYSKVETIGKVGKVAAIGGGAVMPGDTVKAEVYVKYIDTNSSNWTTALNTLLTQIAGGTAPAGTVVDGGSYGSGTTSFPYAGLLNTSGSSGEGPKAYMNWLVFDKDFVLKDGGYVRMSDAAREYGQDVAHEKLEATFTIYEPGYVYVYLSNENETPVEVYFDDWQIIQVKSPLIQANAYYPFGMDIPSLGYQREGSKKNNYLYNGGSELQDDFGLNFYYTRLRIQETDAPRWWQIDPLADKEGQESWTPYHYSFNNPVRYNDPNGDCPWCWSIVPTYYALKAKYSNILKPGQEAGQRLITNKSGSTPSNVGIDETNREIIKVTGVAQDGIQVANSAKTLTKEVAKDGAAAAQESGDAMQKAGIGISAVGLPQVGAPLVAVGSVLETAGVAVQSAINVSEGNYMDAAIDAGGLLLDNKASDQIKKVVVKQGMNEQSRNILEANKEVVKEVAGKVKEELENEAK